MAETASSSGSAAFEPLSGQEYFDSDAHYRSLALGVLGEVEQNVGLILLTGSPPPQAELFARHLERESAPRRHVRMIHGGTAGGIVSLVIAADANSILVIDPPAAVADDIVHQLCCGPSSDDQFRAPVVLLGPESLARSLRSPSANGGKPVLSMSLRFRHLCRHEIEPFIRFQMNDPHLDQSIFKAPLISLIESYSDGDPAVVNSLAKGVVTATQGEPLASFAEVVADLAKQIGGDTRLASAPASSEVVEATDIPHASDLVAPDAALEESGDSAGTESDARASASPIGSEEATANAAAPSLAGAVVDATPDRVPSLLPAEDLAMPQPPTTPEEAVLESPDAAAAQDREVTAGPADAASPVPSSDMSFADADEAAWSDARQSPPAAEAPADIQAVPAYPLGDDAGDLAAAPLAPSPEPAPPQGQAPAGPAGSAQDAAVETGPVASSLPPLRLEPSGLSLVPPIELGPMVQNGQGKTSAVAMRRRWRVAARIAAGVVIAFAVASLPSLKVGRTVSTWFATASRTADDIAPARRTTSDKGDQSTGSSQKQLATVEKSHDAPVASRINLRVPPEANGDSREPPPVPVKPAPAGELAVMPLVPQTPMGEHVTAAASDPAPAIKSPAVARSAPEALPAPPGAAAVPPAPPAVEPPAVDARAAPTAPRAPARAAAPAVEPPVVVARSTPEAPHAAPLAAAPLAAPPIKSPVLAAREPEARAAPPVPATPAVAPPAVAARSEPQPHSPSPVAKATVPAAAAELFLQRGDQLMAQGDIVPARQFFERAAEGGAARAAFRLAKSYDPVYLRRAGVRGILGDPAKAKLWYEKAIAAGDAEAELALLQLEANSH